MAIENYTGFDVISDVGATANSYISVADVKALWNLDPYKANTTLTDEEIARAVISATNQINTQYGDKFIGDLYDETYSLFFPRTEVSDSRGVLITDYTIFPKDLQIATAVQAWYVSSSDRNAEIVASGVKQNKMDGLGSQTFFSVGSQLAAKQSIIAEETALHLKSFILHSGKYSSIMTRG